MPQALAPDCSKTRVLLSVIVVAVPGFGQRLAKDVVGVRVASKELFQVGRKDDRGDYDPNEHRQEKQAQEKCPLFPGASQNDECRHGDQGADSQARLAHARAAEKIAPPQISSVRAISSMFITQ